MENGNHVTRAELSAHLGPMRDDIAEIRDDVKSLLRAGAMDAGRDDATRDMSARVWARLAFVAAILGDIATLVWLTH